jgi:hypothetical protein
MDWIKRNLYFVIGTVLALAMLGGAGWYLWSKLNLNNQTWESLNKAYEDLKRLNGQNPHPGSGNVDNIGTAKQQVADLRAFQEKARGAFQKIPPIPDLPKITDRDFSFALSRTISALRSDATSSGVSLPPDYEFSFLAQSKMPSFKTNTLPLLAVQLGEVKAICDVLFGAKINALDLLRRERVSPEDAAGAATDYVADKSITNELAVLTPYELTFRCFSPELASVLANFASSPQGFVVKTINVEAEGATPAVDLTGNAGTAEPPVTPTPVRGPYARPGVPSPTAGTRAGTLPTVLDERKLHVTMALVIVKLLPPKETAAPGRPGAPRPPVQRSAIEVAPAAVVLAGGGQ